MNEIIPNRIINKWQEIADIMALQLDVPAALIMRTDEKYMEVFISSKSKNNPYKVADKEKWDGLYCETVIRTQKELLVPNALKDKNWDKNPDIELGMISYLGFPINYPDGTPFGTICVLDAKENSYSIFYKEILLRFKKIIEADLVALESFRKVNEELEAQLKECGGILKEGEDSSELILTTDSKYEKLFSATFESFCIHDKGIVVDLNQSFAEMFGYSKKELIGVNIIELFVDERYHDSLCRRLQEVDISPFMLEARRKDGETIPAELAVKIIEVGGKELRAVAVRDIRSRIETEETIRRLTVAVEQSANTIVITDINGDIIYTNPKFTEVTGYTAEEALGQNPRILNAGTQNRSYYEEMWKTISSGEIWKGEFHNKCKDGTFFWEQVTISPIKNEEGGIVNYLAIKEDITARIKAEKALVKQNEELVKAKEKAEESTRLKTEFINNMSHEIRTPLNGIIGFSALLGEPDLASHKSKQYIDIIQRSSKQLLRIIEDILEISVLGTKQVKVIEEEIDLNSFLLNLLSIFEMQAKEKGIVLDRDPILYEGECSIFTDKSKLGSIMSNLLENALKFTNKGFVKVGYCICEKYLEIYVQDTGIGISPDKFKTIFKRFSQENKVLSQKVGGLGLGLSIAKENAELLEGNIRLESVKNEGTTFYFKMPHKRLHRKTMHRKCKSEYPLSAANEYNVLVVEDEEMNFLYLSTLLQSKVGINCKILKAVNGVEAVEVCRTDEVDLVLMDLRMPLMDGYAATAKIREMFPNLPVIAQSAYSTQEDRQKAYAAGCVDFIAKPINVRELKSVLGQHLSSVKVN